MPFRYLRDPLFLTSFGLYWLNRWVIKPHTTIEFFRSYFNDFLCIPFFVPIVLFIARLTRLRRTDSPPTTIELLVPLLIWSILFEIVFPQDPYWSQWVTGDPFDVMWYCCGAFAASVWWRHTYAAEGTQS